MLKLVLFHLALYCGIGLCFSGALYIYNRYLRRNFDNPGPLPMAIAHASIAVVWPIPFVYIVWCLVYSACRAFAEGYSTARAESKEKRNIQTAK